MQLLQSAQPLAFLAILSFSSAPLVSAAGCYSAGLEFGKLTGGDVDGAIRYFCNNIMPSNRYIDAWTTIQRCFAFPENNSGNRMDVSIRNPTFQSKRMTTEECWTAYKREAGACSHGSEQWALGLYISIDPNEGKCNIDPK